MSTKTKKIVIAICETISNEFDGIKADVYGGMKFFVEKLVDVVKVAMKTELSRKAG